MGHRPERVTHLILFNSSARGQDFPSSPSRTAFRLLLEEMAEQDWGGYTLISANWNLGFIDSDLARRTAALYREAMTPEAYRTRDDSQSEMDATPLTAQVTAPTLALYRRNMLQGWAIEWPQELASRIRNAQFLVTRGERGLAFGDEETQAVEEFLRSGEDASVRTQPAPGALLTVLFSDMENSTALTQRLGDAKAQELVRTHNTIVRDALKAHAGSEIKHTGDGIMAPFPSASGALECAVAIQQAIASHVEREPDTLLGVRIGLNAGEPVAEEQDLFGTAVQLARRICDHAVPGQILLPEPSATLQGAKGSCSQISGM